MYVIHARNVNDALPLGAMLLRNSGISAVSRGIEVIEYPEPVATVYTQPRERVLFHPVRDANPFFHFMEALWIIAGRNDVKWLTRFLPNMADYSDNGLTFHAPYGERLRGYHGEGSADQIATAIALLRAKPDTRQVVLQIWDKELDLGTVSKDIPCNDMVFLKVRKGELHMTVCCRSNDLIWGAYGANVVQFSMLQEYIARMCHVRVGPYTQISDSFHVYPTVPFWEHTKHHLAPEFNYYADEMNAIKPYDLFHDAENVMLDLERMFHAFDVGTSIYDRQYTTRLMVCVVLPMLRVHDAYRELRMEAALAACNGIAAQDWKLACMQWIQRRIVRRADDAAKCPF